MSSKLGQCLLESVAELLQNYSHNILQMFLPSFILPPCSVEVSLVEWWGKEGNSDTVRDNRRYKRILE